ncbi:unnamed protein product [Camellia sinensis]
MDWTLKGDRNTKFFHAMASSRQARNTINSITVGNASFEEPNAVKQEVWNHFSNMFTDDWKIRPVLTGDFKSVRSSPSFHLLEAEFSEEEIWAAIKDCNGNKAPGPDGFNLLFFQKFWKLLKVDILNFMKDFYANGKLAPGLSSSFITLIPKKEKAVSLNEYRPICLIGSAYKILSKVLTARLQQVLPTVIGDSQLAFLRGRSILDGVLIANEVVDGWHKSKKTGLLFKLDFEKAFDSINWNFLFSMLTNFGFGQKWISWMRECVSTARISVLINGSPTKEFSPQKGLRQGDPLSPLLFNLVVEALNILFQRAMELNLLKGVSIGFNQVRLSYLQFADDSLLFCEAKLSEVLALKRLLRCFEMASGLKINYHKSVVCGVGVSISELAVFASLLNCKTQTLPLKYLGLPLGANPRRKKTWQPVIDKFKLRLAGWKRRLLSFAGQLILIT